MSIFQTVEMGISKADAADIRKKRGRQVENASAGKHLGVTCFGQLPDGKIASSRTTEARMSRPNDGNI